MKHYKLSEWSFESKGIQAAYVVDTRTELAVDTIYYKPETGEVWTHKNKPIGIYGDL